MQTYDEILNSMTEKYTELSGITPQEGSDISIRLRVLAGEVYSNIVNAQWLKRQMFVSTAQGEYLDMHAQERGIKRREATGSVGFVTFSVSEPAAESINIPKGTVVATFATLLRFKTMDDATIPAGAYSVNVKAQSIGAGREYNVTKDQICVMVTPPAGVESVTNTGAFVGGCDIESDESLRERIEKSIRFPQNGANCAYYETTALSVNGVNSASVVPRGRGAGTVDVYIAAESSVVNEVVLNQVQELLSKEREVNVDVLVKKAQPSAVDVYIQLKVNEGYSFAEVKDKVTENITAFISGRGVGEEVLMCQISECVYHTEGVKSFSFIPEVNSDFAANKKVFPVAGNIVINEV